VLEASYLDRADIERLQILHRPLKLRWPSTTRVATSHPSDAIVDLPVAAPAEQSLQPTD
jgi:hypothetical protein